MAWSTVLTVRVHGEPKGQPRPRKGKGGVFYNPAGADHWRFEVIRAVSAMRYRTITDPVRVEILFLMPRPKSHYRTGRYAHLLKPNAPQWCSVKPDLDNTEKATFDALENARLIQNDSLICSTAIDMKYTPEGSGPGAIITVKRWEDKKQ